MTFKDIQVGQKFTFGDGTGSLYRKVGKLSYVYDSDVTVRGVPGWKYWTPAHTKVVCA